MLHAAERQHELGWWGEREREESVLARLMKRIADNPHDECLAAEAPEEARGDILLSTNRQKVQLEFRLSEFG